MRFSYSLGSSPRVWGQVRGGFTHAQTARIIPTRMGTSSSFSFSSEATRDHPHAYGDKMCLQGGYLQRTGSSPRVWGQERLIFCLCKYLWIIPTRMGTRTGIEGRRNAATDHPHACGDKSILYVIRLVSLGSSPRVWGQDCSEHVKFLHQRIIPTRVGTSICGCF